MFIVCCHLCLQRKEKIRTSALARVYLARAEAAASRGRAGTREQGKGGEGPTERLPASPFVCFDFYFFEPEISAQK